MPATCQATKRDGSPCTVQVVGDARQCWAHDPALATKRAETRHRGGQNKSRAVRIQRLVPASLKPTIAALFTALEEVHAGTLDPKQAQAMAALAGALARLYSVGIIEERVAALESENRRRA